MRGISKKMFISILTSVIVMVTMVATTFAWVGIFTYANIDSFQVNLKTSGLDSNYYLVISSTGKKGTYSDNVPTIEIMRQIVSEKYNGRYDNQSDEAIEKIYNQITIETSSAVISNENELKFSAVNYGNPELEIIESTGYFKFNIYLTIDTKEGITDETTGINANVYLDEIEKMITGTLHSGVMSNKNPFLDLPSSQINDVLKTIPQAFTINSKNASRVGISIYDPIPITEEYTQEKPNRTVIYYGGSKTPNYDESTNSYDLGGCLPEEQNLALKELLIIRPAYNIYNSKDLFYSSINKVIEREKNDLELKNENRTLWLKDYNKESNYFGVMNGVQTKMKMTVYLWFEGWDADCLRLIEKQPVTLNLSLTSSEIYSD